MTVLWMELILGFGFGCIFMIAWLAWDLARWGELRIDLSMGEVESELWHGLHLQREHDD